MSRCSIPVEVTAEAVWHKGQGWAGRYGVPAFSKLGFVTDGCGVIVFHETEKEARQAALDHLIDAYAIDPPLDPGGVA